IEQKDYLELLGRAITTYMRAPGRARQTLAEASFDAWIKYYRPDENSPNATVSYYGKGSLVALCLDLTIRARTRGRKSLDDVMRAMWRRYGLTGVGVDERGVECIGEEVTGVELERSFDEWLRSTRELPLEALLEAHGVDMTLRPAESSSDRGGKPAGSKRAGGLAMIGVLARADGDETVLTHVLDGGAAREAGVGAGDPLRAVGGVRVGRGGLDATLAKRRAGETVTLHAFRRDELLEFRVRLQAAPADTCVLSELAGAKGRLLGRWLRGSRG